MPAEQKSQSSRRNRWLVAFAVVLIACLLLIALPVTISKYVGRRALAAQIKPLREAGEPLTFETWFEQVPQIPDDQNSALIIISLKDRADALRAEVEKDESLPLLGKATLPRFDKAWPQDHDDAVQEFLAQQKELLASLAPIQNMPDGRYPRDYSGNPILILLPELSCVRTLAKGVALAALSDGSRGNLPDAAARAALILNMAGSLDDEPMLISSLVAIAVDSQGIDTLQRILAMGTIDAAELSSLQRRLLDRENAKVIDDGMRGERIGQIGIYQYAKAHGYQELAATGAMGPAPPKQLNWIVGGLVDLNLAKTLEIMAPIVDPKKSLIERIQATKAMQKLFPLSSPYQLVNILMPSYARACEIAALHVAQLRAAQAALAAERYRLEHHAWPPSLDELVPAYIDAVPIDPFDEKPLRYRIDLDRIFIYSIADNLTDDGGLVEPPPGQRSPIPDVGFQLLNPEHRGFKLVDPDDPTLTETPE